MLFSELDILIHKSLLNCRQNMAMDNLQYKFYSICKQRNLIDRIKHIHLYFIVQTLKGFLDTTIHMYLWSYPYTHYCYTNTNPYIYYCGNLHTIHWGIKLHRFLCHYEQMYHQDKLKHKLEELQKQNIQKDTHLRKY